MLLLAGLNLDPNTLFTGAMTGLTYAVLATGLVPELSKPDATMV